MILPGEGLPVFGGAESGFAGAEWRFGQRTEGIRVRGPRFQAGGGGRLWWWCRGSNPVCQPQESDLVHKGWNCYHCPAGGL